MNYQDKSLEAEASNALGGVYQLMADNETALQVCRDSYHITFIIVCAEDSPPCYEIYLIILINRENRIYQLSSPSSKQPNFSCCSGTKGLWI